MKLIQTLLNVEIDKFVTHTFKTHKAVRILMRYYVLCIFKDIVMLYPCAEVQKASCISLSLTDRSKSIRLLWF